MSSIDDIRDSAENGKLVVIAGAGVSRALASKRTPAMGWNELVRSAFAFGQQKGKIDETQASRWMPTLSSGDIDELLGAAEFISRKLGSPSDILYARWLEERFATQSVSTNPLKSSLQGLMRAGVPIATLNYDTLLEKALKLPSIDMTDHRKVLGWSRREEQGILHLHGLWSKPETVVLGITDYSKATSDNFRTQLQRSLTTFNRALFIGCGATFGDPNLSSLILWLRATLGGAGLQHYALVKEDEVEARHKDPLWEGVIDPIGFGKEHADLPEFIKSNLQPRSKNKTVAPKGSDSTVITSYRRFLVADCGQMTIEGVGADADTAKQKFDIEKLFVPLEVAPVPPEFPHTDPNRDKKLKDWEKKNGGALSFGHALAKSSKIALLALPGGGKTLLLKRLAVAYADASRRTVTDDQLPELDLLPVLIRCREWRDFIGLPIATIIGKITDITGRSELSGLFNALGPRLKSGRVLLLVDGLDEIHNDGDRTTFVDNLENFLNEYPKIKTVITSREAGFALVAPSLMRFCGRWRVAPLSEAAITMLCDHWHDLMGGVNGESAAESAEVVDSIMRNDSLTRLAENPLLLTMLLVVKHGYGRLPPDRVSLYDRAVEVLLDTWNIKGHDRLNPREALPQLAYIAYRMMLSGTQTVTESQLLRLIEDCRRDIPLVRLYAHGSPSEFLSRVELRSSLLLEAGRQLEGGKTVKFYQFRHLTFQEYLGAFAAVEGHYAGYVEGDTALVPLKPQVTTEEWKEVIPMAAVLAKKQAASLLTYLVQLGEDDERRFLSREADMLRYAWSSSYRMPAAVSRLAQCFVEEAEFSQANLMRALRLVATFAHGCAGPENWKVLMRGPFGGALFEEAWRLFKLEELPREAWLRNTTAIMAALHKPLGYWSDKESFEQLALDLRDQKSDVQGIAAATVCGLLWDSEQSIVESLVDLLPDLECDLDSSQRHVWEQKVWALGLLQSRRLERRTTDIRVTNQTLSLMVADWLVSHNNQTSIINFGIAQNLVFVRSTWTPDLSERDKATVRTIIETRAFNPKRNDLALGEAAALLAYHARMKINPKQFISLLSRLRSRRDDSLFEEIARDAGVSDDDMRRVRNGERLTSARRAT